MKIELPPKQVTRVILENPVEEYRDFLNRNGVAAESGPPENPGAPRRTDGFAIAWKFAEAHRDAERWLVETGLLIGGEGEPALNPEPPSLSSEQYVEGFEIHGRLMNSIRDALSMMPVGKLADHARRHLDERVKLEPMTAEEIDSRASDLIMHGIRTGFKKFLDRESSVAGRTRWGCADAYKKMFMWQRKAGIMVDEKARWVLRPEARDGLSEDYFHNSIRLYSLMLNAHTPLIEKMPDDEMRRAAAAYTAEFKVRGADPRFQRMRHPMDAARDVTFRALDFLDAVDGLPKPSDRAETPELDALRNALRDAAYLMPGENPSRGVPLSEQRFRGSPDQIDLIVDRSIEAVDAWKKSADAAPPEGLTRLSERKVELAFRAFELAVAGPDGNGIRRVNTPAIPDARWIGSDLTRGQMLKLRDALNLAEEVSVNIRHNPDVEYREPKKIQEFLLLEYDRVSKENGVERRHDILADIAEILDEIEELDVTEIVAAGAAGEPFRVPYLTNIPGDAKIIAEAFRDAIDNLRALIENAAPPPPDKKEIFDKYLLGNPDESAAPPSDVPYVLRPPRP